MVERRIVMGVIGRPHGVRGLVRVHSYTAEPTDLARYAPLIDDHGRAWTLEWRAPGIACLRGTDGAALADRDAAARLTNLRLHVDRQHLPDVGSDEFYLADLIGMLAHDGEGAVLGRVAQVHDYGAGSSLEIAREGAPALLVPFTRGAVPEIDVASGRLVVIPPEEVVVPDQATSGEAAA